jgi:23S rRNA pseudouridine1911/1915/1917 synthase
LADLEVEVPAASAGERLDRFLASLDEVGSRASAERLVVQHRVRVNGAAASKSYRLGAGDRLEVSLLEVRPSELEPEELDLRIAYEDEHLLVVDKPAGIVVHPSAGHASGTLVHGLLGHAAAGGAQAERPGIVHRLDRDTSGLLVVARSEEAHRRLQQALRRRLLVREYLALVHGRPRSRGGRIEAPIGRDRRDPTRISLDTGAPRDAVTNFEVLETFRRHALLRALLETGRTHQIRVHLAAIDLPISGDPAYGIAGDLGLERQFLHAARLAFPHPFTDAEIDCHSPLPADLEAALAQART